MNSKKIILTSLIGILFNSNLAAQHPILDNNSVETEIQQLMAFNISELDKPEINTQVTKQIEFLQLTQEIDRLVFNNNSELPQNKIKVVISD